MANKNEKNDELYSGEDSEQGDTTKRLKKTPNKVVKKGCSVLCPIQCFKQITENQRQQILKYFYGLGDINLRRLFVQKCVERVGDGKDENAQYHFYFTINGKRIKVCKTFFLSTLCISFGFITRSLEVIFDDPVSTSKKYADPKVDDGILSHIKSVPRIVSCSIDKQGIRQYIETSVNVETMYQLYLKFCKEHKYPQSAYKYYAQKFEEQNHIFRKCQESLPLLGENEVTIVTLKTDQAK